MSIDNSLLYLTFVSLFLFSFVSTHGQNIMKHPESHPWVPHPVSYPLLGFSLVDESWSPLSA